MALVKVHSKRLATSQPVWTQQVDQNTVNFHDNVHSRDKKYNFTPPQTTQIRKLATYHD